MKNIIKTLLVVMVLVLAITAFTGCEQECTHEGTTELIPSINPTCTETGMTLGSRCTACGEVILEPKVWEALGHEMTEGSCTEAPACTREDCDYTGELLEHQMEAVEAKEPGCEKVPGHNAHTACKVCGYSEDKEVLTVEGHTWSEPFVYAPATCTEAGLLAVQCTSCGGLAPYTEIPAGHVDADGDLTCDREGCGAHVNYDFAGGEGTAEAPYLIETAEQLANISKYYDTYKYYKVADGVETIDMTGVGKISLHGSFDGNGVKLVNLTTALFQYVGYENSVEDIKISNLDVTMNAMDGCALVRNIFNAGKTTFENVHIHGYIEGLYNMGSFYNYGTANCDGVGADYTVEFINATSDVTLVCTSGNGIGGLVGHGYEGTGNTITFIRDEASVYTGTMYTTNGSACDSFMYMASNGSKFILNGVEASGYDKSFDYPSTKIASVKPVAGEDGYYVTAVEGADHYVVYLNAQVTAYDEEGYKVPNKAGMTWPLGNKTLTVLDGKVFDLLTSAVIVNGTDHEYGYELLDGVLTIYSGRSASYESGNVRLQVNQYDAEGNLLATGTIDIYVIEHDHTFVGQSCTEGGVCNCGTKGKALGHTAGAEATCTAAQTCTVCGDTLVEALGHTDENGDYKCDACSTKMLPADGTALTIPQALAVAKVAGTTYTTQKYYITGIVTNVYNTTYGNLYLKDADGNEICIYGLYTWDKAVRYDKMEYKPVEGDELTVYTVLGMYNTTCQGKDAWMDEVVAHEHDYKETVTAPTCLKGGYTTHTCSICNGYYTDSETAALGHTTEAGTCERCGQTLGGDTPVYETFTADLGTLSANTSYGSYKTTSGWQTTNCAVVQGGSSNSNPTFQALGTSATKGVVLNGKTSAKGNLVSPTLTGGISKLTFNFTNVFSESKGVDITITIKQNGTAVATKKLDQDSVTQYTAYDFVWNLADEGVAVTGDFTIEITNNSPTNSTSNKDRVAIWNIEWTNNPEA